MWALPLALLMFTGCDLAVPDTVTPAPRDSDPPDTPADDTGEPPDDSGAGL